jgi:hypothetical protein
MDALPPLNANHTVPDSSQTAADTKRSIMTASPAPSSPERLVPSSTAEDRPHHDVEGRGRSALSWRLLKAHAAEFKFDPRTALYSASERDDDDDSSSTTSDTTSSGAPVSSGESDGDARPEPRIDAAAAVRSRFLTKLGISPSASHHPPSNGRDLPVRRPAAASYETPLKEVVDSRRKNQNPTPLTKALSFFSRSSSPESSPETVSELQDEPTTLPQGDADSSSPQRSLRFFPTVTVHPIPLHSAYSSRIRNTVWTSAAEMQENVARNCLEFSAENWDWNQVLEDQDMVMYHGEKVHPVHFAS